MSRLVIALCLMAIAAQCAVPGSDECSTIIRADGLIVKSSEDGDYREFVVAVTASNRTSGSTPSMPIVVLVDGQQPTGEVDEELARNLALWSGYALVLNASQIEFEPVLGAGNKLASYLEALRPVVVQALLPAWIELDLPGPEVFVNVFNHGTDTVTYLATRDPFPVDRNYVVLGLGSAAADFAVRLHKEGWPAVIAVDPSSSALMPIDAVQEESTDGNSSLLVISGETTDEKAAATQDVLLTSLQGQQASQMQPDAMVTMELPGSLDERPAGLVWRHLPYNPSDAKVPLGAAMSSVWLETWRAVRSFVNVLQRKAGGDNGGNQAVYCSMDAWTSLDISFNGDANDSSDALISLAAPGPRNLLIHAFICSAALLMLVVFGL